MYVTLLATFVALATAQDSPSCSTETITTIQDQEDADTLAACETYTGSIALASGPPIGSLALNGIKSITGSLFMNDGGWYDLSADSLENIGGAFEIHNSSTWYIKLPRLRSIGSISWTGNEDGPKDIDFGSVTTILNITIEGTVIEKLNGLNPEALDLLNFTRNRGGDLPMATVIFNDLAYVRELWLNGNRVKFDFPNLRTVQDLALINMWDNFTMPQLADVTGTLLLEDNEFPCVDGPLRNWNDRLHPAGNAACLDPTTTTSSTSSTTRYEYRPTRTQAPFSYPTYMSSYRNQHEENDKNRGLLVGIVVGSISALLLLLTGFIIYRQRSRKTQDKLHARSIIVFQPETLVMDEPVVKSGKDELDDEPPPPPYQAHVQRSNAATTSAT